MPARRAGPASPQRRGRILARLGLTLALLLLAASFFLLSPPAGRSYPGAKPWRQNALLEKLVNVMSLGGKVATVRGVEIKELALHLAAALGLLLLALRGLLLGARLPGRQELKSPWLAAQVLLLAWAALSAASALWSRDADISLSQAGLYGLALAWALSLAWTLTGRELRWLLAGLVGVATVGATLCIWYYHQRNPYHRPGFPIGNPGVLAACLLPAILAAICAVAGPLLDWLREGRRPDRLPLAGAALSLVPLAWCLRLADSRAALVGLAVGLLVVVLIHVGRRTRWTILGLATLLALAGGWWLYSSRLEPAMARGATVRFRLYAWRYAAELWQRRPVSGVGAGSYTRLAGWHSLRDRALDPGAFMGELVEHAHNELFEVLAEIGLLGGVTFVGGYLATFVAGAGLLRGCFGRRHKWALTVLLAGLAGMLADSMFGVSLRLPGAPAVFYTLLGACWACCREAARAGQPAEAEGGPVAAGGRGSGPAAAALSLALALGAGWLALRNWGGVLQEARADVAYRQGDYRAAERELASARWRLLDPPRKLEADLRRVRSRFELARGALRRWRELQAAGARTATQTGRPAWGAEAARREALARCRAAYAAAAALNRRAPGLGRMLAVSARCAEMLARLEGAGSRRAREWLARAEQAWRLQRQQAPYDVQTLLALTGYPGSLADQVALLRDALRAGFSPGQQGQWLEKLRVLSRLPGFAATLEAFVRAAQPYNPQSDIDALVSSAAPEAYRLSAAWKALRGEFSAAARDAARAAALYRPLRPRFPTLYSVALAFQAEYSFRADPGDPARSASLLRRAIGALPRIQAQKYAELLRPYRLTLARYLLAAGRPGPAAELLRQALGDQAAVAGALSDAYVGLAQLFIRGAAARAPARRPPVRAWLEAALELRPANWRAWSWRLWLDAEARDLSALRADLRAAAGAGVSENQLRRIRRSLQQEFPSLRDELGRQRD